MRRRCTSRRCCRKEPYEATGRWTEYGPNIFRLKDRKGGDYLLAPTHEEMFTLLVKDLYSSYKDLPLTLFQIQTKYRDEARPRAGLIRGREFIMKDAYSFDVDDDGLEASYQAQRDAYQRIFDRLGLEYVIVAATSGAMGGSRSEEFLTPTPIGEDTFVRSPGGYAANVEAVTTVVPDAAAVRRRPRGARRGHPGHADDRHARRRRQRALRRAPDRAWTAADTLKNVVLALVHPTGERELLVVGLPGDREVDLKRLEAAVAPAEVEAAGDADFAAHPELVRGYIGPRCSARTSRCRGCRAHRGPLPARPARRRRARAGSRARTSPAGTCSTSSPAATSPPTARSRPPRCAPATRRPTAPVRSSSRAASRSATSSRSAASTPQALGLTVLDQNGKAQVVTMGSYGIGVTRVLAALAEANNDERGLAWPAHVAPAHVHVVATGKDPAVFEAAEALAVELSSPRHRGALRRPPGKVSPGVKFADAELLGRPAGGRRRPRAGRGRRRGPSARRRHHGAGPGRRGGGPGRPRWSRTC